MGTGGPCFLGSPACFRSEATAIPPELAQDTLVSKAIAYAAAPPEGDRGAACATLLAAVDNVGLRTLIETNCAPWRRGSAGHTPAALLEAR